MVEKIGLLQRVSKKRILIFDLQKAPPPFENQVAGRKVPQPEVCAYF